MLSASPSRLPAPTSITMVPTVVKSSTASPKALTRPKACTDSVNV